MLRSSFAWEKDIVISNDDKNGKEELTPKRHKQTKQLNKKLYLSIVDLQFQVVGYTIHLMAMKGLLFLGKPNHASNTYNLNIINIYTDETRYSGTLQKSRVCPLNPNSTKESFK